MSTQPLPRMATCAMALLLLSCAHKQPYDYTNFRAHPPRSILVLPPLNETTAVEGTYGYLSTVSEPIAERGYYVFPVAVVDQFLKENGMPTPGEMHQVPFKKVLEIMGADAVMFLTLKQYGSHYRMVGSAVSVEVVAKLVDTRTGILLWEGVGQAAQSSSANSGSVLGSLIAAAVTQAVNKTRDAGHEVSRQANQDLFTPEETGLPYGPYSPKYTRAR